MSRKKPPTISSDRIELLCHIVNRVSNNMPSYTSWLEFYWALQIAIQKSNLPESWKIAALKMEMIDEYRKSFKAKGYSLKPDDLREVLEKIIK